MLLCLEHAALVFVLFVFYGLQLIFSLVCLSLFEHIVDLVIAMRY